MAALEAKLEVVNPVAEIVPDTIEMPDPAVKGACTFVPITKPKFALASAAVVAPVPPLAIAISVALQIPLVIVPTLVKLEPVTVDFSVVPVNVPASAVTVMSAEPSNATPLMFFVAASFVAVLALPVKVPVKLVEVTELKPVTEVTVPPNVMVVEPKIVVLFANCPFVMPAIELKFAVVNPVAEIVPEAIEIPEPAVNGACTFVPITKPKFALASAAVVAPVPPLAISIVDALQVPEVIVPTVAKLVNDVKVVFDVAVMLPAVVAVVALPRKLGAVTSCVNLAFPCTSN